MENIINTGLINKAFLAAVIFGKSEVGLENLFIEENTAKESLALDNGKRG